MFASRERLILWPSFLASLLLSANKQELTHEEALHPLKEEKPFKCSEPIYRNSRSNGVDQPSTLHGELQRQKLPIPC